MYYILDDDHKLVPVSLLRWGKWFETANRHVGDTTIQDVRISTVFLGMDHGWFRTGPPIVFETMIFGGYHDQYQERYSTWDEAVTGHEVAVALVVSTLHRHDQIDYLLDKLNEDEPGRTS